MNAHTLKFNSLIDYCDFDYIPVGLHLKYEKYIDEPSEELVCRKFLDELFDQYQIPELVRINLTNAIKEIEQDEQLFLFTRFLVKQLMKARNSFDPVPYNNMTPNCMKQYGDLYSFIVLIACIKPSLDQVKLRGIPQSYYEAIPHKPLKMQFEKLVINNDPIVSDFPWDLNFYTCSIFLLDRFLFIPHKFEDSFTMYRNQVSHRVIALKHAGVQYRRDGQQNGINDVVDQFAFTTTWVEQADTITAHKINPMGFVEQQSTSIDAKEWKPALQQGNLLLALHIPAGPGYTPERLKSSMSLALQFFDKYYPEMNFKGFWSASWLYDTRLSLVLDNKNSNIVKVQRQFFIYPTNDGDQMLRYELFGSRTADPLNDNVEISTSLQRAAVEYMKQGGRFNTLSMVFLRDEVQLIGEKPYITDEDIKHFERVVDTHL